MSDTLDVYDLAEAIGSAPDGEIGPLWDNLERALGYDRARERWRAACQIVDEVESAEDDER